mmetsp:Transcript_8914/g.20026  ORF Transcript_8914/g.20026 Transcript_8914/m.20026 type:complete len:333 (-) Transcript_8914:181-1179(-)
MIMRSVLLLVFVSAACAFSPGGNDASFSLSSYQKARAEETSKSLDASRFHFQILFVDSDNFHGRIAEGMLARVAEYNDALCILFPASATIESSPKAPMDSAAPEEALTVCESLGLCTTTCSDFGTAFDLSLLDEYDLIIALDDEIQALILRSLPAKSGYEQKCRLLSEFLSIDFCGINAKTNMTDASLQDMIEQDLLERAEPFYNLAKDSSSSIFSDSATTWEDVYQPRMILSESGAAVPNINGWPMVEAAMLVACAGVTRFCLDTMDAQFDTAFQYLLDQHFCRPEHLEYSVDQADEQLRKGSCSVTGYFSLKQRRERIEQHLEALRMKLF